MNFCEKHDSIVDVSNCPCDCGNQIHSITDINSRFNCPKKYENISSIFQQDPNKIHEIHKLSGLHICELPTAKAVFENDLYLVSRLSSDAIFESKKISYSTLKTNLIFDLQNAIKVGSMAYEPKTKYSLTSHNHNSKYNLVKWHPNEQYYVNDTSKVLCLGMIRISTETLTNVDVQTNPRLSNITVEQLSVNCPKVIVSLLPKPAVGTLRIVSTKTIQKLLDANNLKMDSTGLNVMPYNENNFIKDSFDGWVFANGTTFSNHYGQLADAAEIFAGSKTAQTFTIPALTNFFQIAKNVDENYSIYDVPEQIGLDSHSHVVDPFQLSADITVTVDNSKLPMSKKAGSGPGIHTAGNTSGVDTGSQDMKKSLRGTSDLNQEIPSFMTEFTGEGQDTGSYYPTHNLVPVMIYIGGVNDWHYTGLYDADSDDNQSTGSFPTQELWAGSNGGGDDGGGGQ